METLLGRLQVADSSNQYNPFNPRTRTRIMDQPCVPTVDGTCVSRTRFKPGVPMTYVENPPPEMSESIQRINDDDVGDESVFGPKSSSSRIPRTIGTDSMDMSRGQMLLPSAADMPIVRRLVMFDTRFRDPSITPTASSVRFKLDQPILSVSRISVHSARVPIHLDPTNVGMQAEDYAILSVGLNLYDTDIPVNQPDGGTSAPTFNRALAYIPLIPHVAGSNFATIPPYSPPGSFYTDFLKPIPSIESVELSWWRFQKTTTGNVSYIIPNTHPGEVGDVAENAYVILVFYCKNRRPE